ncbi:DUF1206 domain-containing protein [Deinococcus cavernae]|uniref:DUF1206 domain-containing protein n=1 Tax=Deinococcus cavernae TaxID=2320857 RepID=A0A418V8F5_9DEIO|nr:DUF1206 domain-containing protein [Deinococcus cavernae]RJF72370.1 DUF1206 domain-containing protein [Deinococcus cavernae]
MADLNGVKNLGQQAEAKLEGAARAATHRAAPQLEALARFGYASKGVVYGTIGLLALSLVLGRQGAATDAQGALLRLQDLPGGGWLMWLLVLGLIGYALWQLIRATLDPERQGTGGKGLLKRLGYLVSGLGNMGVALFAARLAREGTAARNANNEQDTVRQILEWPGGQLLLGIAGLALLAVGANSIYSAYGAKFMKRIALTDLGAQFSDTLKKIGQVGLSARGLVLGIIGVSLLVAAFRDRSASVLGSGEVLTWLGYQPAGKILLGLVALGTLCYGVWCFVQARYRRIRIEG